MEISDEVVELAIEALRDNVVSQGFSRPEDLPDPKVGIVAMRAALQAAIPLVVEGLVPTKRDNSMNWPAWHQGHAVGFNDAIECILAKVKK